MIQELKSVEQLSKLDAKQVFMYLKFRGVKLGFLLNLGAKLMKDRIKRIFNGLPEESLGVLTSLRETQTLVGPVGAVKAAPPHRSPLRSATP